MQAQVGRSGQDRAHLGGHDIAGCVRLQGLLRGGPGLADVEPAGLLLEHAVDEHARREHALDGYARLRQLGRDRGEVTGAEVDERPFAHDRDNCAGAALAGGGGAGAVEEPGGRGHVERVVDQLSRELSALGLAPREPQRGLLEVGVPPLPDRVDPAGAAVDLRARRHLVGERPGVAAGGDQEEVGQVADLGRDPLHVGVGLGVTGRDRHHHRRLRPAGAVEQLRQRLGLGRVRHALDRRHTPPFTRTYSEPKADRRQRPGLFDKRPGRRVQQIRSGQIRAAASG